MGNQFYRKLVDYLEVKTVSLAKFSFMMETIGDTDKLIAGMNEKEFQQEDRFPYWAELWPSSVGLGEHILENRDYFNGKKVLELGCGLGLAGIAARAAGADVVFSDYDPLALEFTRRNFKRNFNQQPRAQLLDWRSPVLQDTYDIIIGADILYERKMLNPVLETCRQGLGEDGLMYMAEPGRIVAGDFLKTIVRDGGSYQTLMKKIILNKKQHTIHIYKVKLCFT
jgi:ETFB lysine methyltransferase